MKLDSPSLSLRLRRRFCFLSRPPRNDLPLFSPMAAPSINRHPISFNPDTPRVPPIRFTRRRYLGSLFSFSPPSHLSSISLKKVRNRDRSLPFLSLPVYGSKTLASCFQNPRRRRRRSEGSGGRSALRRRDREWRWRKRRRWRTRGCWLVFRSDLRRFFKFLLPKNCAILRFDCGSDFFAGDGSASSFDQALDLCAEERAHAMHDL